MTQKIPLNHDFQELNSITLTNHQKERIWENINQKSRKRTLWKAISSSLILTGAAAFFLILALTNMHLFQNEAKQNIHHPEIHKPVPAPAKVYVPAKSVEVGNKWEIVDRLRCVTATVESFKIKNHLITSIVVKQEQYYGSDADPLGYFPIMDKVEKEYTLLTDFDQSLLKKGDHLILSSAAQYADNTNSKPFYGAKVEGIQKKDGKYYTIDGKPTELVISSKVQIKNGSLIVKK
jgi:hypothetical protein